MSEAAAAIQSNHLPRVSKRKYQQSGRKPGSSKLGHLRNPRSAEAHAAAVAPFIADRERTAALGIDPKYMNANAAIYQGKKPLVRKVASMAWRKAAKAWDQDRARAALLARSEPMTGVTVETIAA